MTIQRDIGDRNGEAISWFNLGNTGAKIDRLPDALEAYRKPRQLFADMGLEAGVQDCDNTIGQLTSDSDTPRRNRRNPFVQLWQ